METKIVGYRYGRSPASGCSTNFATGKPEAGVSMASAENLPECRSFATMAARETRKTYYYSGNFAGFGSDDEVLISNPVQITKKCYLASCTAEARDMIAKIKIENFDFCRKYEVSHVRPLFDKIRETEIIAEINSRYDALIAKWK